MTLGEKWEKTMIIPSEVDVPFDRHPFVNWLIVGVTILVFGWQITVGPEGVADYILDGFNIKGLFGHMWLHAGFFHIVGNLIFLWVFGNAVCAKIGNILYLPVYIALGLFAAVAFNIFSAGKMLGASGAINGIVGMYLVFYPLNNITCYWIMGIFTRQFTLSSYWMILMWLAFDFYGVVKGGGGVAFAAHLGGFAMGVGLAIALLQIRIIRMNEDERSLLRVFGAKDIAARPAMAKKISEPRGPGDASIDRVLRQRQEAEAAEKAMLDQFVGTSEAKDDGYIRFRCSCQKRIKVPKSYAGKKGKCPGCALRIIVPAVSVE